MDKEHLTDEELIKNIKRDRCSESLQVLAQRHAGMFFSMAKRYANYSINCSGVSLEDFEDNRHYIVYQAAQDFDPAKKTKFVTWLGNKVRYFCLNTLHKESKYYNTEPEKFEFLVDNNKYTTPDNSEILSEASYVYSILAKIKDPRVRRIFDLRYFSENKKHRSFSYIGKKLHMSTQGVIDIHDNFLNFIKRKMEATTNMDDI